MIMIRITIHYDDDDDDDLKCSSISKYKLHSNSKDNQNTFLTVSEKQTI